MKTPREILFERHRQAEPKLEAARRRALAALPAARSADELQPGRSEALFKCSMQTAEGRIRRAARRLRAALRKGWLELIWPSRRAWAGMAALWLAVLAANLEMKATSPRTMSVAQSAPIREVAQAFKEQRRLLAELLAPFDLPPATPAAPARPSARPRSERSLPFKAC